MTHKYKVGDFVLVTNPWGDPFYARVYQVNFSSQDLVRVDLPWKEPDTRRYQEYYEFRESCLRPLTPQELAFLTLNTTQL
jgi:hypothetical protein